ncbi:Fibronectin type III domain-containing protein [Paenibacillus sp. UNCCL117]|uniref:fibronectin type III domain-containing protein n=1 Tax=unclassified Paenibacillus TaxID=185978 RepID=UPI00088DFDE2|nr:MULTISPECIES: discoidin domain-containing protein [unclassified Paenibacillus]SDD40202.1 Fibronectin type III domain-containing protein [Paenibacillus sp. cl123]SFW48160.1 Fibronectin type III domain-containing protein [Paenibacillus sp. UNCCL117]
MWKKMHRTAARLLVGSLLAGLLPLQAVPALAADTQPPGTPANLESVWRTEASAQLTWSVPADDTGVTGYDVYRDGALEASVSGAPLYRAEGLNPGTDYVFTVRAKDAAGNVSAPSTPVTVNLDELDRGLWTVSASHNSGSAARMAIDALPSSRWTSGANQASGMWFQIDTGPGAKSYHKLVIDATGYSGDYARGYSVAVSEDGENWSSPIASGNGSVLIQADFAEQTARYLRITLTKGVGNYWSIQNLKLFGSHTDDLEAPAAPGGPAAASVTDTEASLTWSPSADNVAVLGYEVYAGAEYAGFTRQPALTLKGLAPRTAYTYQIRAVDMAGHKSSYSEPVAFTTQGALERALWSITASHGAASVYSAIDGSASTRWSSGAAQAAGMWLQLDTGPGGKAYNKLLLNATGSNGDYPREFQLTVSEDGESWSAPIGTFTGTSAMVQAVFPEQTARFVRLTLTKGVGSYWSVHELNLYGLPEPDENPPTTPGNLTVKKVLDTQFDASWDASTDDIGVAGYNIYLDSVKVVSTTPAVRAHRFTGLTPNTAYSLVVKARDVYGNESAPAALTVTTQPVMELPLIAKYEMEPQASDPAAIWSTHRPEQPEKAGSFQAPAAYAPGRPGSGQALVLSGSDQATITQPGRLNRISSAFTISAWIKPDDLNGYQPIASKRDANWKGTTFYLGLQGNKLYFGSDYGEKWYNWSFAAPELAAGQWSHVAAVFEKYEGAWLYVNGKLVGQVPAGSVFTDLLPNELPVMLGTEWHFDNTTRTMVKYGYRGAVDSLRMYAAPLTQAQIQADMNNTIMTRPAADSDFTAPTKYTTLRLVRFDTPTGLFTKGSAKIHQNAARREGPDAVDWPRVQLHIPQDNGAGTVRTVEPFASGPEYKTELLLQQPPANMSIVQQPYDNVLSPGNHWLRGVAWRWGQTNVYTTDRTARSWTWDYELWTFPVKIAGASAGAVRSVILKNDGQEIYNSGTRTLDSLTLLLPQNESGKPYELWVDGRGPVRFDAGLAPIVPGDPKDIPLQIDLTVPGPGPAITVTGMDGPETFPHEAAWNADVQALSGAKPPAPAFEPDPSAAAPISRHVGTAVPRSPESVNFVYLPHGMSSGSYYHSEHSEIARQYASVGTVDQYADYVADTGYDRVYEFSTFADPAAAGSHEHMAQALAERGVQLGLIPRTDWDVISTSSQNLPFYSSYIADYHAPLYRELQLGLQRLSRYPNVAGISLGADNAAYAQYWDWAPPHPNRPWGRAFAPFQTGAGEPLTTPIAPSLQGQYSLKTHEYWAGSVRPFLDYIGRYNETFREYGYFARAAAEVNAAYTTTTGSYGSSPGVGGRGGWLWATIPGKEMHEQLPVQTAYDWNELNASKPLHAVSLIDKLRSYAPNKPTWAIQDDFSLFFGKADREKTYAMTLTRGIQAIGTNVLPNDRGPLAHPQMIGEQKELYAWIHKYGGAYALTEPTPSIGIMYVNDQALLRGIVGGESPSEEQLLQGSHEGKVSEALFLTHAAGWPSKIITPEELKRGLPSSIKAILLVGLNEFDASWHWYDGLVSELQSFVDQGGRILKDSESVSPVASAETGMQVASYVIQSNTDQTNLLLSRNTANIAKLRTAMAGVPKPAAYSDSSTVWAVPTRAGDTEYVTVLNERHDAAAGESQHLLGQTAALQWNTARPIYDVRQGRKLTPAEAAQVDLQTNGFQWYALPPAEVTAPGLTVTEAESGFYEAFATIRNPEAMAGIPLELTVTHTVSGDSATVYTATGLSAKLPLHKQDAPGIYTVKAKELLSGLETTVEVNVLSAAADPEPAVRLHKPEHIRAFAARSEVPLTIALTAAQQADPAISAQAERLVQHFAQQGRDVALGLAEPGGVVKSLQTYKSMTSYPQWLTLDSDLVLLGTSSTNVLLLDQARGYLLPEHGTGITAGHAAVSLANSPFVGERHALNIVAADAGGVTAAVDALLGLAPPGPGIVKLAGVTRATPTSVALSWAADPEAAEYRVERRSGGSSAWQTAAASVAGTAYTDEGLAPGVFYTYRITAVNGSGQGPAGDPLYVVTPGGAASADTAPPTAPGELSVLGRTANSVSLGWTASSDNIGVAGYDVYQGALRLNEQTVTGVTYTVYGLLPATSYTFTVKARDAAGNESPSSMSVTAATYAEPGGAPYKLERTGWTASASHQPAKAANAVDGKPSTRWDTGVHQVSGQWFQLDLGGLRTFNGLEADTAGSAYDYPRSYEVYVSADGVNWGTPAAAGAGKALLTVRFPAQTARYVKLVQTGAAGNFWSIHELNLLEFPPL